MKTIGIIGGMGPLATVDLYAKIVYAAQGKKDGDHVPVLLSGRPDIPDRAASICGTGPSALPALLEEARRLEQAARLLLGTRESVSSIAAQVGFESPAYFTSLFRARYGKTPSRYRDDGN